MPPITNKVNDLKSESDAVQDFLASIGNPEIEEHVGQLPIPPQAKEFFINLTRTVIFMAKKVIDGR